MEINKTLYLFAGLAIILMVGCAKPVVKNYPPSTAYDSPISTEIIRPENEASSGNNGKLIAAVTPLAQKASDYLAEGELERAEATVERALRINPNQAELWSLMAKIKLAKGNWNQAEQLAAKSNLLAGNNSSLKAKNWRTIAKALQHKKMPRESLEAIQKARKLESR